MEAVEKLAARAGITLRYDNQAASQDHQRRSRIHETLAQAIAWYHQRLLAAGDAASARSYLRRERGYDGSWFGITCSVGLPKAGISWSAPGVVPQRTWSTPAWPPSTRPAATPISSGAGCSFPIFDAAGQPVGCGRAAAAWRSRPQVQEHCRRPRSTTRAGCSTG